MTPSEKKKPPFTVGSEFTSDLPQTSRKSSSTGRIGETKKMRRVNPLGMRVVVRLLEDNNQTDSGLFLPEGAKLALSESLLAEVIEVATASDLHTDEETNVSGVPLGATILFKKELGVRVPWDDTLRIVETRDILAVVHEISIS